MPIQAQTLAPGPCSHPLLDTLLPSLLKRLGQTSRLKTKSFISILLSHMFRYNQNSWTNLLNESPALSAIAGPGRPGNTAGGLKFRGAGIKQTLLPELWGGRLGKSRGRGVGVVLAPRIGILPDAFGLLKNPNFASRLVVAPGLARFRPKQGARANAGLGSRPGAERSAGWLRKDALEPRPLSGCRSHQGLRFSPSRLPAPPSLALPQPAPKPRSWERCGV